MYLGAETHVGVLDLLMPLVFLVLQVGLMPGIEVVGVDGGNTNNGNANIEGNLAPSLSGGY